MHCLAVIRERNSITFWVKRKLNGFTIKEKYKEFDSLSKFNISFLKENDNKGCSCGEVLIGLKEPRECKLFGTVCTPLTPIGACMVSEEGACSAYYKYC